MSTTRYIPQATHSARILLDVLARRPDTDPRHIAAWRLTEDAGQVWLFAILDDRKLPNLRAYTSPDLCHHLSTALRGRPVVTSNHTGLRLAVLLTQKPQLPHDLPYPGWRKGQVQIGTCATGTEIVTDWEGLGHVLCAGMTGSGKSNFLRLIVAQAIPEGHRLLLGDLRGRTFGLLEGHPALLAPLAESPDDCAGIVQVALAEMNRRAELYRQVRGAPETLVEYNAVARGPLPRLLLVLNEYNSLVMEAGGPKGDVARAVTLLTTQGRGYGITVILAGQKFQREIVGSAQDQCRTRLCFAVQKPSTSRVVLDRTGAERLKAPGRALTDPWGLVQVYSLPKELLPASPGHGLTPDEERIAAWVSEHANGRLTIKALTEMGLSEREARRLRDDWQARGLAIKRPEQDNALCLAVLPSEPPWASEPVQTAQTGAKLVQTQNH
jgi:DNA segregation ATPase FtsK/SpoIIIE-like protein